MKKARVVTVMLVLIGLLFSAANVFADSALAVRPPQTPGAKATEKAGQHASNSNNGNNGNGNGQGADKTPGAKATEKADKKATQGIGKPKGKRTTYRGTVTAVGANSLTLGVDGGSKTFAVNGSTRIHIPTLGRDAALADMHTGVRAMVQVLADDASQTAVSINVVPGKPQPVHRVGIVTAYTPGASITVQDKKGGSSTFLLSPDVKILPKHRAGQLAVGSLVTIISRRDPTGGPLTAQGIVVHPPKGTQAPGTTLAAPTHTSTPTTTPTPTVTSTPTATPAP